MARLIDAEKLEASLPKYPFLTDQMIRFFRTVIGDQEVLLARKSGHWIESVGEGYECSECWSINDKPTLYCPRCGSRNKKEIKHEED